VILRAAGCSGRCAAVLQRAPKSRAGGNAREYSEYRKYCKYLVYSAFLEYCKYMEYSEYIKYLAPKSRAGGNAREYSEYLKYLDHPRVPIALRVLSSTPSVPYGTCMAPSAVGSHEHVEYYRSTLRPP
jgi:hypothetical protein